MNLKIKAIDGSELGSITVSETNEVIFDDQCQPQLKKFIDAALAEGIRSRREIYDTEQKVFVLIEVPIERTDPLFPLAFRDFLKRSRYIVEEMHPKVDAEIKRLLAAIPNGGDKQYIHERLPALSCLDKTFILEMLRKAHSPNAR